MRNNRFITLKEIKELKACSVGIAWFEETFGERVSLKELLLEVEKSEFKIWIVDNLLTKSDEDLVIESNDAITSYFFATKNPGADIPRLQEVSIAGKNPSACYQFAMAIPGADIKRLQEAVITGNDAYYCYLFALDIPGADIQRLQEVVISSKDKSLIAEFIRDVKDIKGEQ